jgi:hypothetical protein
MGLARLFANSEQLPAGFSEFFVEFLEITEREGQIVHDRGFCLSDRRQKVVLVDRLLEAVLGCGCKSTGLGANVSREDAVQIWEEAQ